MLYLKQDDYRRKKPSSRWPMTGRCRRTGRKKRVFPVGDTPFQQQVYQAVSSIPAGQTRSYRWVAEKIGSPRAARAVGQALKRNPCPVIVPCHRVVRSDGSLGGYSRGITRKKRLLNLERTATSREKKAAFRRKK